MIHVDQEKTTKSSRSVGQKDSYRMEVTEEKERNMHAHGMAAVGFFSLEDVTEWAWLLVGIGGSRYLDLGKANESKKERDSA